VGTWHCSSICVYTYTFARGINLLYTSLHTSITHVYLLAYTYMCKRVYTYTHDVHICTNKYVYTCVHLRVLPLFFCHTHIKSLLENAPYLCRALCLSLSLLLAFSLPPCLPPSRSLVLSLSLSFPSLSLPPSLIFSRSHIVIRVVSLSLAHTQAERDKASVSLSFSHTNTHTCSFTLSFSLSHTHAHTPAELDKAPFFAHRETYVHIYFVQKHTQKLSWTRPSSLPLSLSLSRSHSLAHE